MHCSGGGVTEIINAQLSDKDSVKLQLDDYKQSCTDLSEQLAKSQENVSKLRIKLKDISELESTISDRDGEIATLNKKVAQLEAINEQNQSARQEQRKEYQDKCRLQVEKSTLEAMITSLREELAVFKNDRRNSIAPGKSTKDPDASFEALPNLADELMTAEPPQATQVR
eukprot:sb/3472210/